MLSVDTDRIEVRRDGRLGDADRDEVVRRLRTDRYAVLCGAPAARGRECESENGCVGDPAIVLVRRPSSKGLEALIGPDVRAILEVLEPEELGGLPGLIADLEDTCILVDLTTATAFAKPVAGYVCDLLRGRLVLSPETDTGLQIALHEAVANALLHGNLEIASSPEHEGLDGLDTLFAEVDRRLADRDIAQRRVRIRVCWDESEIRAVVTNEGPGYDHSKIVAAAAASADRNRRGTGLINRFSEAFSVADDGRHLSMTFRRA